jgi:hypothetical protein
VEVGGKAKEVEEELCGEALRHRHGKAILEATGHCVMDLFFEKKTLCKNGIFELAGAVATHVGWGCA